MRRDAVTWAAYAYCGSWGWLLFGWGPAIAQLRDETGVSRGVSALHSIALSTGSLVAGTLGVLLVRRFGRRTAMVGGALAMAAGIAALLLSTLLPATLAAALVIGVGGAVGLNAMSPVLAAHHPDTPSSAISEANAVAAGLGVVSPLAIGATVWAGWGWRPAVGVGALVALVAGVLLVRAPAAAAWGGRRRRREASPGGPLGATFWTTLAMLGCTFAVEFAIGFWAVDLLRTDKGLAVGAASAAVAAFGAGMALSRWGTPALARRWNDRRLLGAALATALAGWALLWASPLAWPAVGGLALLGLGAGLHFPLGISLLIAAAPGRPDTATAFASAMAGVAGGAAPFLLGTLADQVGPRTAFVAVPGALVAAAALLLVSRRASVPFRPRPLGRRPAPA